MSERGKKLLIFNNYKFSFAHESQCGKTRWRCAKKTCPAKMYTISNNIQMGTYIKTIITINRYIEVVLILFF